MSKSVGSTKSFVSGIDSRLGFFPTGRSGLRLAESGAVSLWFSNMEINDVAGGREVVSVVRLSTLDRADLFGTKPLLGDTSTGCRRGEPFSGLFVPLSPPENPAPAPEATAPVPGLALRLAASVAAIKLALFGSAAFPVPGGPEWVDNSGLLPSSELRNRDWRSLSLSAASPRMLDDPVVCLLIPTVPPVECLLSWLGVRLGLLCIVAV